MNRRRKAGLKTFNEKDEAEEKTETSGSLYEASEDTIDQVELLVSEIRSLIAQNPGMDGSSLRNTLKALLNGHPQLKDSSYRDAINDLIISESDKHEAGIDPTEVDGLWAS
ncbi:hypothetical protein DF947_10545 [Pedobacter paludis]|uniref:Uncharacterized protein n=2 Tax=Pedobacter paludis TaxID=2203212 RepID=A0A317F2Y7_9SPHI|nr:hypothetical protein DF947_10545 [Pedobacter paludis]